MAKESKEDNLEQNIKIEPGIKTFPKFTGGFFVYCMSNTDIKNEFMVNFNHKSKTSFYNYSSADRKHKEIPAKYKLFLLNALPEATLNLLMTEYEKINLEKSVQATPQTKNGKQK